MTFEKFCQGLDHTGIHTRPLDQTGGIHTNVHMLNIPIKGARFVGGGGVGGGGGSSVAAGGGVHAHALATHSSHAALAGTNSDKSCM
jgi:hypothetical protein